MVILVHDTIELCVALIPLGNLHIIDDAFAQTWCILNQSPLQRMLPRLDVYEVLCPVRSWRSQRNLRDAVDSEFKYVEGGVDAPECREA